MLMMMMIEKFLNFIRFLENYLQHLCVVHKAKGKSNAPGWRVWVWQFRNKHNWTMTRIWNFYFPPTQLYTHRCLYNSSHLFTALCNFHLNTPFRDIDAFLSAVSSVLFACALFVFVFFFRPKISTLLPYFSGPFSGLDGLKIRRKYRALVSNDYHFFMWIRCIHGFGRTAIITR